MCDNRQKKEYLYRNSGSVSVSACLIYSEDRNESSFEVMANETRLMLRSVMYITENLILCCEYFPIYIFGIYFEN